MTAMTELEKLRRRLGKTDLEDALLTDLLEDAEGYILAYTGLTELPQGLAGTKLELACVLHNRMGMQGETGHAEGGISVTAEGLPENIRLVLNRYRRARVV